MKKPNIKCSQPPWTIKLYCNNLEVSGIWFCTEDKTDSHASTHTHSTACKLEMHRHYMQQMFHRSQSHQHYQCRSHSSDHSSSSRTCSETMKFHSSEKTNKLIITSEQKKTYIHIKKICLLQL